MSKPNGGDVILLYDASVDFRDAVDTWVRDRRCPYNLADFLREHELHAAAAGADWCATAPDRGVYAPVLDSEEAGGRCGPYPTLAAPGGGWFFFPTWDQTGMNSAEELPSRIFGGRTEEEGWLDADDGTGTRFPTPQAAIVFALSKARIPKEAA